MAKVTMPQLGESVAEGTIGKWLKQPGDHVAKYEPLVEVITDKVNAEVPSPFEGILREILAEEGATVPNNAEIAVIETADEGSQTATPASAPAPAAAPVPAPGEPATHVPAASDPDGRMTPAVRRLLREHELSAAQVAGTGGGGRITREDVLKVVESIRTGGAIPTAAPPATSAPAPASLAPQ